MKLRNLISAALLVGVGSTALPAAATIHTTYPANLPPNCSFTTWGPPLPRDVRGDTMPTQTFYVVRCSAPQLPSWMTW